MRSRLYLKLYVAFLAIVTLAVLATGLLVSYLSTGGPNAAGGPFDSLFAIVRVEGLAPADAPVDEQARALEVIGRDRQLDLALWDSRGRAVTHVGTATFPPPPTQPRSVLLVKAEDRRRAILVPLVDGRWLGVAHSEGAATPGLVVPARPVMIAIVTIALVLAIGCYPLATRITTRLERVEEAMNAFGRGALDARAPERGRDEVARIGGRFNEAAERIARLVDGQRRMLASASHELRSPLGRLRMAVDMLGEDDPEDDRAALLDEARTNIHELDAIVGDILLSSRVDAGIAHRSTVDLAELIAEEVERATATIELDRASIVADRTTSISGDRGALRRLLRNLFENAAKYGSGGAIQVHLRPVQVSDGDGWEIAVEDSGPGIAPELRERVFEPFFRIEGHHEGEHGGVGLGLALVRQIARSHGGDARVEARPGGGGRVVVELSGVS